MTFALRLKIDNLAAVQDNGIMGFWETGNVNNRVVLRTNGNSGDRFLLANVKDGVWTGVSGGPPLPNGEWVHLMGAIAKDGTTTLYLNGQKIVSGMTQPLADVPREEVRLGATMFAGQGSVQGGIADVVVYNKAVTDAEAQVIYQASLTGVHRWAPTGSAGSWSHAAAAIDTTLTALDREQRRFAGAANSLETSARASRQYGDVLTRSIGRLIEDDMGAVAARQKAAEVSQALALVAFQSAAQTGQAALSFLSGIARASQGRLLDALA